MVFLRFSFPFVSWCFYVFFFVAVVTFLRALRHTYSVRNNA